MSNSIRDTCPHPSNPRRDNNLWLQLWKDRQQDDFHLLAANPLLIRFWPTLKACRCQRILVPLCGKSMDMVWLSEQGYEVIGIELSPIAVKAFFAENRLKAKRQRIGNFVRWRAGNISIWCGDYFSMTAKQLGQIDAVLDRAALTALASETRKAYIDQLVKLTESDTRIMLFTLEVIDKATDQSAKPIDKELTELCKDSYTIKLLYSEIIPKDRGNRSELIDEYLKVYQLRR